MKTMMLAACLAAPWLVLQTPSTPAGPEVGKPAPSFRLNDQEGVAQAIGGKGERWTVLAFYPKAMTGGCTKECQSLRDSANAMHAAGIQVFGLSLDSVVDQKAFHAAEELNFALLSDPDGSVAVKYGVLMKDKPFTERVTFVIDPQGVLRAIDREVDVASHGDDVVRLVETIQDEDLRGGR
jgi:peroxiredoxin Q/BCP